MAQRRSRVREQMAKDRAPTDGPLHGPLLAFPQSAFTGNSTNIMQSQVCQPHLSCLCCAHGTLIHHTPASARGPAYIWDGRLT